MPSRFEYERAVRSSGLPPMSRLLALTLATWADIRTGVIPPRLMPSLSKLEESTGMARGSVRTHLDRLEDDDWLIRNRPSVAAARAERPERSTGSASRRASPYPTRRPAS